MNGTLIRVAVLGATPGDLDLPDRYSGADNVEWCRPDDDPQAVIVVPPDPRNSYELIQESLQAGHSVFCPLPVGLSSRQIRLLSELSAAQGRILRLSEPHRYLPGFPLLRRLLGGREPFWRAFYVRSEWLTSGSRLALKAMAMQDLVLYDRVFDARPRSVSATAFDDERTSGPCGATLLIEYSGAPPLQCTVSQVEATEKHQMTAAASDRVVSLDQRPDAPGLSIARIEGTAAPPALKRLDTETCEDFALKAEFADFVRCVSIGDRSFTNAHRWVRASAIWSAARRSIRCGRRVDVESATAGTTTPPPLIMLEGGGSSTRVTGKRPALTVVAG